MSSRTVRTAIATLGVASLLAAGAATVATTAAEAFPVRICSPDGCKTVCRQPLPNGGAADYDEGAKVTITHPNGERATYKCTNGEWVQVARTRVPVSDVVAPPGSIAPAVDDDGSPVGPGLLAPTPVRVR